MSSFNFGQKPFILFAATMRQKKRFQPLCFLLLLFVLGGNSACTTNPEAAINKSSSILKEAEKHYKNGDFDSAYTLYKKSIEIDTFQPSSYYKLGNIAFKQNKLLEAQSWYLKCLQLKPHHIKAHHNLSIVYLSLAKPHMDYFNSNASKQKVDQHLDDISSMIAIFSENKK